MTKWKPGSRGWERAANELARTHQKISPCARCFAPTLHGYCCQGCGCGCSYPNKCDCARSRREWVTR